MNARLIAGLILVSAAASLGSGEPSGEAIFNRLCTECHGEEGHGDGPKAKRLGFSPQDLGSGVFKCRCTPSGKLPTDEDLARTIANGIAGTPMRGFSEQLSPTELRAVVEHVKSLAPVFGEEPQAPCISVPEPPTFTAQSAAEGAEIYKALWCWSCHGADGRGDGPAAKTLVDDRGNPIRARNFVVLRKFKCGAEPHDLYRSLHTGLDGTPMASFAKTFLFPRELLPRAETFAAVFEAEELAVYEEWADAQPDETAVAVLSEAEKKALVERRTWALVAFLRSLRLGLHRTGFEIPGPPSTP